MTNADIDAMSPAQVVKLVGLDDNPIAQARRVLYAQMQSIAAYSQRRNDPIHIRKMELKAVIAIAAALNAKV